MTRRPWRAGQFAVWPLRLIHTFFRRVTIDGAELLAKTGPVIVVANHGNGLVDGMLLISMLPRWPRFAGKAALFDIAPLKRFLKAVGVIPVYRAEDAKPGRADRAAPNDATFAECRRLLGEGAMVAIFSDGISHDLDTLQPLKTGAARIALTAVEESKRAVHRSRRIRVRRQSHVRFPCRDHRW
jgi:glycerol-3-phosphate O-acyltransferase/dihydroxyacetone phosphate acyltransferase